ncbi:hypothetical protein [Siphonobacter sp.]|uniref:hypothetical protein n=1 Tax=Siphonobacter sp. TaxID=1869184 RepID=UPI003B3ADAB1
MKTYFFLILLVTGSIACQPDRSPSTPVREVFDSKGLRVITSFFNKKAGTMSTLYGNQAAFDAALSGHAYPVGGETFTLATWKSLNSPYWFGSDINGKLECVETLTYQNRPSQGLVLHYQLKKSTPEPVPDTQARIRMILAQRPSVFPEDPAPRTP